MDGGGPYRFVIETGADFTTASPRVAAAAGLAAADSAKTPVFQDRSCVRACSALPYAASGMRAGSPPPA